jgi:hypothetical protein
MMSCKIVMQRMLLQLAPWQGAAEVWRAHNGAWMMPTVHQANCPDDSE